MHIQQVGLKVWVRGIVQGVGFRPYIYSLAAEHDLTGWVRNTSAGVEIEINGAEAGVSAFLHTLQTAPPPLAKIDEISSEPASPNGYTQFEILESAPNPNDFIPISPDMATCPDCQRELFDPADRRFRYPFINCTNCGPRFTIIRDIPYDRPKTTMAGFPLCPDCKSEYENPLDRRFHAQPVACPVCGPKIWFESAGTRLEDGEAALRLARQYLKSGKILAIKGLGGYHLACDATNSAAVQTLRERKKRSDKPFALMAFNLKAVERHCTVSEPERSLLLSRQRPVVLLQRRSNSIVAAEVAPNQQTLGVMLAYTPLHLLLLEPEDHFPELLVMTSGNMSEEPIAYQDDDAMQRLNLIADGYLLHDRPVHMRTDDSVARIVSGNPHLIRRARGYAPDPVRLPFGGPNILASGAELKNTFCLSREQYAFVSHHIGDLENFETLQSFEQGISHFEKLFRVKPQMVACDLHPDYLSTRYARHRAETDGLPLFAVQHHHAHLAACLADNRWESDEPVIGLSFDGTGLGTDGAVWGGEVLLGGYRSYQRVFHLAYTPLPGGDAAVHKPARMALSHLWKAQLDWEPGFAPVDAFCAEERNAIKVQIERGLNAPLTSSIGRLFDAVSAALGVCEQATYEGQAAIELEALVDPDEPGSYEFEINAGIFDPAPLWQGLLTDWRSGVPVSALAARFHNSVARVSLEMSRRVRSETGIGVVALSGGVWQNRCLFERTVRLLEEDGFRVLTHQQVPANDGGLALGQVAIALKSV